MKRLSEIFLACAVLIGAAHAQTTLDLGSTRAHGILPTTKGGTGTNAADLAALKTYLGIGAAGAATWGHIGGTISEQDDLVGLLGGKVALDGTGATGTWGIGVTGNAGGLASGTGTLDWTEGTSTWSFGAGNVTAGAFSGSGAGLTGILPTALTGAGQVPVASLGTGTPTANTVLLGSGAWGTVPAAAVTVVNPSALTGTGTVPVAALPTTGVLPSSLTGAGTIPVAALPANVALLDAANTLFFNATPTTGATKLAIKAGAGQSSTRLQEWLDASGVAIAYVTAGGTFISTVGIAAPSFSNTAAANNASVAVASTGVQATTAVAGNVALTIRNSNAAPTGDLLDLKDSGGTVKAFIGSLTAPASVAGNGTAAPTALSVTGAAGGASTGTTGQTGGAGSSITLTGGAGGAVAGAGGIGGAGGDITLTPGAGGAGAATNGRTGKVSITIANVPDLADNAAALAAGLTAGMLYRTGDILKITH